MLDLTHPFNICRRNDLNFSSSARRRSCYVVRLLLNRVLELLPITGQMSVKPERRSGASPAEVANKKPVKGVPIESCKDGTAMTSEMVPSHYISTGTIFHLIGRGGDSITRP